MSLKPARNFDSDAVGPETTRLSPAEDWAPDDFEQDTALPLEPETPKGPSRLFRLLALLVAVLLLAEGGWTLWEAWQRGPGWFGLYAAVAVLGLGWLGRGLWREWRRLRQLKRQDSHRRQGERLLASTQRGEADGFLRRLGDGLPAEDQDAWQQCQTQVQPHHTDAEQLVLYENTVLTSQDQRAQACIYRYAAQSSLLLAASPLASLDMALMLWRNQRMLDEIAIIYGIEPGYWARVALVRKILVNLLYAGGSELALDLGTQMLSAELTGKLSARVAQGLGAGLLTARLGYAAMAQCRPLPFGTEHRPSLLSVQGRLLGELTRVTGDALTRARDHAGKARK